MADDDRKPVLSDEGHMSAEQQVLIDYLAEGLIEKLKADSSVPSLRYKATPPPEEERVNWQ